jgi:hypothetical protein
LARQYSRDQLLVVAAFQLDVDRVKRLLDDGANVNARFGVYDKHLFEDIRTRGYSSIGSDKWTALLAVADSHRDPQPPRRTENTSEALTRAMEEMKKIDPALIAERDKRRLAIAKMLIKAKANLALHDGYGATALYKSITNGYDELSMLLIDAGADVNTKCGVYIDGSGDITPLHNAANSPRVVKALLQHGAAPTVRDTSGWTPLHWAALHGNVESVRLLIEARAEVNARDNEGHTPMYWARTAEGTPEGPGEEQKRAIAGLLRKAGGQ